MTHVSTLKLHQLRLGELPAAEATRLRGHVEGCALCRSRQAHQQQTRREFEALPEPLALSRPRWQRVVVVAAPLLAAALVLFSLLPSLQTDGHPVGPAPGTEAPSSLPAPAAADAVQVEAVEPVAESPAPAVPGPTGGNTAPTTPSPEPTTRTKGATIPRLEAWVMAGDSERPLYAGEVVGPGTRVQLRYDALGRKYATFAGRDKSGVVEVYATVANEGRGLATAPFALTLDYTPGDQVFYVFLSDHRPSPGDVNSALSATPVRMRGAIVTSLTVQKD